MGVMLNHRVVHNFVVEMFFDSVPNFKRTRGDCYIIIIYDYANVRFNNKDSQLKDGERAEEEEEEEEKLSKTRCRWFDVLATIVCRG